MDEDEIKEKEDHEEEKEELDETKIPDPSVVASTTDDDADEDAHIALVESEQDADELLFDDPLRKKDSREISIDEAADEEDAEAELDESYDDIDEY
ncbi:MAG: hypothetical protein WAW92_00565 [Minisyncoccia bacterium]